MLSSGIGIGLVDLQGRWLEVNPALERMSGYTADEMVGRAAAEITHPDDIVPSREFLLRILEGDQTATEFHKRYIRRDGSLLWAHANVAAMRDRDGAPIYLIVQIRDVSAQHDAEQALMELNDSLEVRVAQRTAELAALSTQEQVFAYGVSHDLRAPIRAIDSFAQLLGEHPGAQLDDTARDWLDRIRNATARMGGLVDALLELSRVSRAQLRLAPVDMSLLAEWSIAEKIDAVPGRAVETEVQPGLEAFGDEHHLKQLLGHLIQNAWTFSQSRDVVRIRVSGERRGDLVDIHVEDEGIGFDMRYADRMFEPFQRLHGPDHGGGHGIGLAIAHRIVARHRGSLTATSAVDGGSRFTVTLPAMPLVPAAG